MNTILAILLLVTGTNPMEFDKPTIYVDGYIELNHYWVPNDTQPGRTIPNGKGDFIDVPFGVCQFDQIMIRQYNKKTDNFDIVHQMLVKNGRLKHQCKTAEELEAHRDSILREWEQAHRKAAKDFDAALDEVIVYHDSPYVGPKGINQITFNHLTKRYEVYMKAQPHRLIHEEINDMNKDYDVGTYKFTSPGFRETNTLFDPEYEDINKRGITANKVKFIGYQDVFKEMMRAKRGLVKVTIVEEPEMPHIEFED